MKKTHFLITSWALTTPIQYVYRLVDWMVNSCLMKIAAKYGPNVSSLIGRSLKIVIISDSFVHFSRQQGGHQNQYPTFLFL
jgi:hypothetical protein